MTKPSSFDVAFTALVVASGRRRDASPAELVGAWGRFVAKCQVGYRGSASDYFNELTSRDSIEAALQSEQLSGYAEMADLEEQVAQIDARFRVLLRPDAFPRMAVEDWWTRGIVRFAGPKLVRELKQTYRVTIAEI